MSLPDEAQYWADVKSSPNGRRVLSERELKLKEEKKACRKRLKELFPDKTDLQLRKEAMKNGGYIKYLLQLSKPEHYEQSKPSK